MFPDTITSDGFEACMGLQCLRVSCGGGATTSISGTAYAPNGTLPLPNVEVYVPNSAVAPLVDGPTAPRCDEAPSGRPMAATLSDTNGDFVLKNVPVTTKDCTTNVATLTPQDKALIYATFDLQRCVGSTKQ